MSKKQEDIKRLRPVPKSHLYTMRIRPEDYAILVKAAALARRSLCEWLTMAGLDRAGWEEKIRKQNDYENSPAYAADVAGISKWLPTGPEVEFAKWGKK